MEPARRRKIRLLSAALVATLAAWAGAEVYFARPQDARRGSLAAKIKEWCCVAAVRFQVSDNLAQEAKAYLARACPPPLSAPLSEILADARPAEATQPHPLLGQPAPDFVLPNDKNRPLALAKLREHGPVAVVFFYGFRCDHCVAQLFALQRDLSYFEELGAGIVAVSADPPKLTAERFQQYGRFAFPTASDADHAVARRWGASKPGAAPEDEEALHGVFLIDRAGIVRWANVGPKPFTDNRTLLKELAKLKDDPEP